jgi:hypothetical protein
VHHKEFCPTDVPAAAVADGQYRKVNFAAAAAAVEVMLQQASAAAADSIDTK